MQNQDIKHAFFPPWDSPEYLHGDKLHSLETEAGLDNDRQYG
jgi:hypothetical protein